MVQLVCFCEQLKIPIVGWTCEYSRVNQSQRIGNVTGPQPGVTTRLLLPRTFQKHI